jgi:hypothetical protein
VEWRHLIAEPYFAGQDFTRAAQKPVYRSGQVSSTVFNVLVLLFDIKYLQTKLQNAVSCLSFSTKSKYYGKIIETWGEESFLIYFLDISLCF